MLNSRTLIVLTAIAASVSVQVVAQQPSTPAAAPGLVATTNNPNLAVATVKLENGMRASKVIGAAVYDDANEKVGSVDDLVMTAGNKVTVAVVSMGGVLGVGSRLVAFPFEQLKLDGDKVLLTGVAKDALSAMPSFVY